MKYKKFGKDFVLRVETGEDIFEQVMALAEKEDIRLASVSGIGAVDDITLGVFNLETKQYDEQHYTGNHEITALCGNITTMDGKKYVHLHMTAAGADGKGVAGHLFKGIVSLTGEIFISVFEGEVNRKFSEKVGINLIEFN